MSLDEVNPWASLAQWGNADDTDWKLISPSNSPFFPSPKWMNIPRSKPLQPFTASLKTWYSLSKTVSPPNPCPESVVLSLAETVWPRSWVSRCLGVDCVDGWSEAGIWVCSVILCRSGKPWLYSYRGRWLRLRCHWCRMPSGRGRAGPRIGCYCATGPWKVLNGTDCGVTGAGKAVSGKTFAESTATSSTSVVPVTSWPHQMPGPGAPAAAVAAKKYVIPSSQMGHITWTVESVVSTSFACHSGVACWHWFSMSCVEVDPGPVLVERNTPPCWGVLINHAVPVT